MNPRSMEDRLFAEPTEMPDIAIPGSSHPLEEQLATIIVSARNVAIAAEELLREVTQNGTTGNAAAGRSAPHAIAVAPRLLAATEQQLLSVSAMLRKV